MGGAYLKKLLREPSLSISAAERKAAARVSDTVALLVAKCLPEASPAQRQDYCKLHSESESDAQFEVKALSENVADVSFLADVLGEDELATLQAHLSSVHAKKPGRRGTAQSAEEQRPANASVPSSSSCSQVLLDNLRDLQGGKEVLQVVAWPLQVILFCAGRA